MQGRFDVAALHDSQRLACIAMQVVGWLGFVGAMTAVSSAGYSVSLNFRKTGGGIVSHLLTGMTQKKELVTFKVRDLLVSQKPFEEFVQGLVSADFLAPCYLTVASVDGGVVVPRGKGTDGLPLRRLPPLTKAGASAPELPTNTLSNERYSALVQTNHDAWCQGRTDRKQVRVRVRARATACVASTVGSSGDWWRMHRYLAGEAQAQRMTG